MWRQKMCESVAHISNCTIYTTLTPHAVLSAGTTKFLIDQEQIDYQGVYIVKKDASSHMTQKLQNIAFPGSITDIFDGAVCNYWVDFTIWKETLNTMWN